MAQYTEFTRFRSVLLKNQFVDEYVQDWTKASIKAFHIQEC